MLAQIEQPDHWNDRLEMPGLVKPGNSQPFTGTDTGEGLQEVADQVFGRVCNWTELFWLSKPGPLANYLDPLLTQMGPTISSVELNSYWGSQDHNVYIEKSKKHKQMDEA